jgi:hypothetical protein
VITRSCGVSLLAAALCFATPAAGQEIRGTLRHAQTQQPLPAGQVRLLAPSGAVLDSVRTDSAGTFRFALPRDGSYALSAERSGFAPSRSEMITVGARELVTVSLLLDQVVVLSPLQVTARARQPLEDFSGWLGEFRFRRRFYEPFGARYFTREDFDWMAVSTPSQVVASLMPAFFFTDAPYPIAGRENMPTLRPRLAIRRFNQICEPTYFVNWHPVGVGRADPDGRIEDFVNLADVTAIEVYRPGVTGPFGGGCGGAIVFWTLGPDRAPQQS